MHWLAADHPRRRRAAARPCSRRGWLPTLAIASVSVNARVRLRARPLVESTGLALDGYPRSVSRAARHGDNATGDGVGVAVIDTGIDGRLPDFADGGRQLARRRLGGHQPRRHDRAATPTGTAPTSPGIIAGDGSQRARRRSRAGKYIGDRAGREPDRDQGRPTTRAAGRSSTRSTGCSSPSTTRTTTTSASSTCRWRRRSPSPTGPTRSTPRSSPPTSRHRRRRGRRQPRHRRGRRRRTRPATIRSRSPSARVDDQGTAAPRGRRARRLVERWAPPRTASPSPTSPRPAPTSCPLSPAAARSPALARAASSTASYIRLGGTSMAGAGGVRRRRA